MKERINNLKNGDAKYWLAAAAIATPVVLLVAQAGALAHEFIKDED